MAARTIRLICGVMLLVFPASMMLAESQAAMVMVRGVAALNGAAMAGSTTIFSGDLLETGANSTLTINAKGSTILIGSNSRVHYFGDAVELHLGSTQINTSQGLKIETDTVKIEPNKTSAKFRVDRSPHLVVVASLEEEIRVNNNGEITILPPGGTMTLVEKDDDQTASPVSGPSNRRIFVIGAIGTGAAAGLIYWRSKSNEKKAVSNQIP
ncbi:MAG: hypothetical protein ROO76_20005 [Terriglobia bacterium]|jgi:hypothetical protein|nr:hypothetical protein [Terriglobia bacterium]